MCQIFFCEKSNPSWDALQYANDRNSHGFGYAWSEGNSVYWNKGHAKEDLDRVIEDFLARPFPKAIHFRLATHGGVSASLTHPFPIKRGNPLSLTGDAKAVLFHNGVWAKWDDCMREAIFAGTLNPNVLRGAMSDSRAMAILCQRYGPDILDVLPIGSNKVLVLTHNTWYRYGDWKQMDGYSASNHSTERPKIVLATKTPRQGVYVASDNNWRDYHRVPSGGPRYLTADREEVEQSLLGFGEGEVVSG